MHIRVLIPLLLLAGCRPASDTVVPLYQVAPAEPRAIAVDVEAAGVIEPEVSVEVKSKASGEILAVHAETGDLIESGALLVEIDQRIPRNRLAEAEATLTASRARRTIAETQMKRAETLFRSGTLTQVDFEVSQLEFANAQAQVVGAEVALENARIAMDDTEVRAPITGTVIQKYVEPGSVISSPTQDMGGGTILLLMANLSTVQVRTLVDETDIGKITPGLPARVTVAAYPNQPFEGRVLKIEPQAIVEQNVTMFAVLVRLENTGGLLKPGMNAEVSVRVAEVDAALTVPTIALRTRADLAAAATMLGLSEQALAGEEGAAPAQGGAAAVRGTTPPGRSAGGPVESRAGKGRGRDPEGGGEYEYGGRYWVVALRDGVPTWVPVRTGITDMEYSEVVAGLAPGDEVLLLPSTSLYEQQQRLQEFIDRRFAQSPFQTNR
jgi:HlyD family secretion protein